MKKLLLILSLTVTGCAFHQQPYVMHAGNTPQSETAVFASLDDRSTKFNDSRILSVNGKKTPCAQVGCPYWVRVTPGSHTFKVRYTSNHHWNLHSSGYSVAELDVALDDMKPRHVYVLRYLERNDEVVAFAEDLGENPDYGITLGLEGVNKRFYKVDF
jgi:hypothetical protein